MIRVLKGESGKEEVAISRGSIRIGRDSACDLVLPWDGISRIHCKLGFRHGSNGRLVLWLCSHEGLKGTPTGNGTFVNGRRVIESELNNGDKIEFGRGSNARIGGALREEDKMYVLQVTQLPTPPRSQGRLREPVEAGLNFNEWRTRAIPIHTEKENRMTIEASDRDGEVAERALNKIKFFDRKLLPSEGTLQAEMGLVATNPRKSYKQDIRPEEKELAGYTSGYGYISKTLTESNDKHGRRRDREEKMIRDYQLRQINLKKSTR
uniref:FHA domain-containing protein n=1 Tax=Guillardia theta TaxID=55529 RepID=A0A6U5ZBW5_GUITH|mmetsp:Transcript_26190/g.86143  ORF Transcript_26190/g.86143 Transcript_26190/m.86143 type:complete len:265 (+) Transcript_26190:181-975(+)